MPNPIDLSPTYPGCWIRCLPIITFALPFQQGQTKRLQILIPKDKALVCAQFCSQGLAVDPTGPGGLFFSDCLRVLIGL